MVRSLKIFMFYKHREATTGLNAETIAVEIRQHYKVQSIKLYSSYKYSANALSGLLILPCDYDVNILLVRAFWLTLHQKLRLFDGPEIRRHLHSLFILFLRAKYFPWHLVLKYSQHIFITQDHV
jgi:hypothetical protein